MVTLDGDAVDGEGTLRDFLDGSLRDELGLSHEVLQLALALAKSHMERGAFPQAFRIYTSLVLCEPKTVDFQVGLANCALQLQLHELALQTASVIIALAPRDPRGYLISGRACLMLGLFEEARQDLTEAVDFGRQARSPLVVDSARKILAALPGHAPAAAAHGQQSVSA